MEHLFEELCPFIREAGLQHRDSWKSLARRIYDHQFMYCFEGSANIEVNGQYHKIKKGNLIIIPPDTPHRFWVEDNEEGELYWFHCDLFLYPDRQWVSQFYTGAEYVRLFQSELIEREHIRENPTFEGDYKLPLIMTVENTPDMEYRFCSIFKVFTQQSPYWQLTARSTFMKIFTQILIETRWEPMRSLRHSYVIHQIQSAVAQNYYRKISVAEICAETGLNTEYASKIFRQESGQRLVEYVTCYRLNRAKKLLLEVDLSVADIAEMVGFSSENYFCSAMKKYEGMTPMAMRNYLMDLLSQEKK